MLGMPPQPLRNEISPVTRAASYVRMSTDHQVYSAEHQRLNLAAFASAHGFSIIREYADEGKSGLDIRGRAGLRALIQDVGAGSPSFTTVLVYDVSRWGRFQDVDESAHYEYVCRSAGVSVLYCAEPFANDGSPMASLIKSIKRTMAAEYSRELSTKVFNAQSRFITMGYKQGGSAGFALRRLVVGADGEIKHELRYGERKGATCDRVVFIKGPDDEIEILRNIYSMYVDDHLTEIEITRRLNAKCVPSEFGRPWTPWLVHSLLTNEKYLGNLVFNRGSFKLQRKAVHNPPSMWIRLDAAFDPPIPAQTYHRAQAERARRQVRPDKEFLLQQIREIARKHGKVTTTLLTKHVNSTMPKLLARHFGTITNAYLLAGISTTSTYEYVATRQFVTKTALDVHSNVVAHCREAGSAVVDCGRGNGIVINRDVTALVVVMRTRKYAGDLIRWKVDRRHFDRNDFVIAVQLGTDNASILGYYLLPSPSFRGRHLTMRQERLADYSRFWYAELSDIFHTKQRLT